MHRLTCTICLRSFTATGKKTNRVCGRLRCVKARNHIKDLLYRLRTQEAESTHCEFCPAARTVESKYCEVHVWMRDPCPGCGGNVRRNEGQGNQPRRCLECRRKRLRVPRPEDVHAEVSA